MIQRIKYISVYDLDENRDENRLNTLSSTNKVNYIINVLNDLGYGVDVISTSQTMNNKCYGGKILTWRNNTLKLFPTTWRGGIVKKAINLVVMRISLFFYLLFKIKRDDTVIMYHSDGLLWVNILFMIKKVHLIEECEEIYGDIYGKKWMSYLERKLLIKADAYIYPTYLLNSIVNVKHKPYLVVHGAYKDLGAQYFSDRTVVDTSFDNQKYHVAYTGILDPKKGCIDFVHSAIFLDEKYHIHVLGFGDEKELNTLMKTIANVSKRTKCFVSYDGLLKGKAYSDYLSNLNLGICPLNPESGFIGTQFPSKIISYLAAGVKVLCSNVEAIKTSDVASAITFYSGNTPEDIAKGIIAAQSKSNPINTMELISDCDKRFHIELNKLINNKSLVSTTN